VKQSDPSSNDPSHLKDEDNSENLGLLSKMKKKKYLYFAGILFVSIIALSLFIWLVVSLASKGKTTSDNDYQPHINN
jgi:cytoskeletal protein RodZ